MTREEKIELFNQLTKDKRFHEYTIKDFLEMIEEIDSISKATQEFLNKNNHEAPTDPNQLSALD